MKIELLQKDKLRICLSPLDMEKYDLCVETLDYGCTETRAALWRILDEAKRETGFDAAAGSIAIHAYPAGNGGCRFYISKKVTAESDTEPKEQPIIHLPPADDMTPITERTALALPQETHAVYRFENAELLARACLFLERRGYDAPSDAYVETLAQADRYYLTVFESTLPGKRPRPLRENLVLGEFGRRLDSIVSLPYLSEHCEMLCEKNAIAVLAALA